MVYYTERVDCAEDDELISIVKDKEEDAEMQMLTPIMLESMWDVHSPPDIFRTLKEVDKLDDDTVMTTESFSEILMPTFDTPPRITSRPFDDDDTSEVSFDSYGRGEVPSPRNVISKGFVTSYPFRIPPDVRFEGEVSFLTSRNVRRINLQPRHSAYADSIFVQKTPLPLESPHVSDYALADSISCFDDRDGAEECKDDDVGVSSNEEGFAFVVGDRFKEDQYWGHYDGHYGSHDFEQQDRGFVDYALDHESVQGFAMELPSQLARIELFSDESAEPTLWEDLHNFFSLSCFSCTNSWMQPNDHSSSNRFSSRHFGSFEPDDYGVSPRATPRFP
jgi:hypothetical protein